MLRAYLIFRILTLACASAVIIITFLFYFGVTNERNLLLLTGVLAVLASIFGIFIAKPIESELSGGFDKLLLTYDKDSLETLQNQKKEAEAIRDFIEHKSNEIVLVRLRNYLEEAIIYRYQSSEIAKLIVDLQEIEAQLDAINVQYGNLQLPERFKKIVEELNRRNREEEKLAFYRSLVRSLPLPSFLISVVSGLTDVSLTLTSKLQSPINYKPPKH